MFVETNNHHIDTYTYIGVRRNIPSGLSIHDLLLVLVRNLKDYSHLHITIVMGVWAAYNRALTARPVLVKALTSLTGFTVGDILAQKVRYSGVASQGA